MSTENATKTDENTVIIKKYANRRLYNTETSSYVTLDDLCEMVKEGREFVVYDAKTNADLTCQILTQIIFEQETRGANLLPIGFLRSVIRFYDDGMQGVMQRYLDASIQGFMNNQEKMRDYMGKAMGTMGMGSPFSQFEEITRANRAMMEKAFTMFNPFAMFTPRGNGTDEENSKKDGK